MSWEIRLANQFLRADRWFRTLLKCQHFAIYIFCTSARMVLCLFDTSNKVYW